MSATKIQNKVKSFLGDAHTRDMTKWASISFVFKIGSTLLQFLFILLLSRALKADGMGKYSYCLNIILIASILGNLGIDKALLRFIPVYSADNYWKRARRVFSMGSLVSLTAGLTVSVLLWFLSDWIFEALEREALGEYLRWFIISVVPLAFIANLTESFKGLKMITTSLMLRSLVPVIGILGVFFIVPDWGLLGIIWTYDFAVVLIALGGLLMWYFGSEKLKRPSAKTTDTFGLNHLFKSSIPLYGLAIFHQINVSVPIILLGVWVTDDKTGQFFNAQKVAMMTSLFLIAFNTILASKVGHFFAKGQVFTLEKTVQKATFLVSILAAPLFVFLFIFSNFTMSLFGDDFTEGGILLRVLLLGKFVNVMLGPVGLLLIIGGREKLMRNTAMFSSIIIISVNLILLPRIGVMGAAIASSVADIAQNLLAAYFVFREFKVITIPKLFRSRLSSGDNE